MLLQKEILKNLAKSEDRPATERGLVAGQTLDLVRIWLVFENATQNEFGQKGKMQMAALDETYYDKISCKRKSISIQRAFFNTCLDYSACGVDYMTNLQLACFHPTRIWSVILEISTMKLDFDCVVVACWSLKFPTFQCTTYKTNCVSDSKTCAIVQT